LEDFSTENTFIRAISFILFIFLNKLLKFSWKFRRTYATDNSYFTCFLPSM